MLSEVSCAMTLDQLTTLIGTESFDDWIDRYDSNFDFPYDSSLSEEENAAYSDAQRDEDAMEYIRAVVSVAESLLAEHKLVLCEEKSRKRGTYYRVVPATKRGWMESLREIRKTINGVGMFTFSSTTELLSSGPYKSAKQGVLHHLHWIKWYPEVYGGGSVARMIDSALR